MPSSVDNCVSVTESLLKLLKVKVIRSAIKSTSLVYPNFPSLLAISDALKRWNLNAFPTSINYEDIAASNTVCIAQIEKDDDDYFTTEASEVKKDKGIRGRGAVGKQNVAITAASIPLEDFLTRKKSRHCRYFEAKVLDTHKKKEVIEELYDTLEETTIVFSDQSISYVDISDYVELHSTEKSDKQPTKETPRWVHIAMSNTKRNLLSNYHKIKGKYLQPYLNEFIYKINRRYFGDRRFDKLVIIGITGL